MEKIKDDFYYFLTEEEKKLLVSYLTYLGFKALKYALKEVRDGNCDRGSIESDDESQGMHEGVSLVPGE